MDCTLQELSRFGRVGVRVFLEPEAARIATSSEASRLTFPLLFAALTGCWAAVQLVSTRTLSAIR